MPEYEVLNTEIRSLLFMHSYGYELSVLDFGQLSAIKGFNLREPFEKVSYQDKQLIYRDFGIVRLKSEFVAEHDYEAVSDQNENEDHQSFVFDNYYSVFAFYDDY